jgi:V8-like Glu-specific endopeptidase
MFLGRFPLVVGISAVLSCPISTQAQERPLEQVDAVVQFDSGEVRSALRHRGVIYAEQVQIDGVPWVRLQFDDAILGQPGPNGSPTLLRLTSMLDGAQQLMNATHLEQWSYTSAYFNGDTVLVEIIADPDAAPSRVSMKQAWAGVMYSGDGGISSICFGTDDRQLSNDPAQGRLVSVGCTAWLFNDANRCFLTAGHCTTNSTSLMEFNVPLSQSNGTIVHPPPTDQYAVDLTSVQSQSGGAGNDWKYFGCFPNTTTGLTPIQAQGAFYTLAAAPPAVGNPAQPIRITGYGTVSSPVSLTWNQVQKTHVGPYFSFTGTLIRYQTDTTGGNSGSPVVDEDAQLAIGIHTHAGCTSTGGSNQGTAINHPNLLNALANPQGVCIPQGFTIGATPTSQTVCAPDDAVYTIDIGQGNGDGDPVTLSANAPAGTTVSFSVNPVFPPGSSIMTISNTAAAAPSLYMVQVTGVDPKYTLNANVTLELYNGVPAQPALALPADGATGVYPAPSFGWNAVAQAQSYDIQVASDPAFTQLIVEANVALNAYSGTALAHFTTHYWRVRANSPCGSSDYSTAFSFTTGTTPPILLVDDDDNNPDVRSYYTAALDGLSLQYDIWNTANSDNEPSPAQLAPYQTIIWFTGDEFGGFCGPSAASEAALSQWLDAGGCLFICSQDYRYDRGFTNFMDTRLGVATITNDVSQTSVTGLGSVFTGYGPYTLSYPFTNFSDRMVADADAELSFNGNQQGAAVNKDGGTWRTSFWGFPLEAVNDANARRDLIARILDWCSDLVPEPCAGDIAGNNSAVDIDDLLMVINNWGAVTPNPADIDDDGDVDVDDLLAVINAWGPCE